ncbi:MAG: metal ABC transporter substrate-binding protein [Gaiellaceae bacterium]
MILIPILAATAAACGGGEEQAAVVAAFYPLAFAAREVAAAGTPVLDLTPPGVEPHDAELSPREVERVRSARVVLYLGRGFQPALEEALEGARGTKVDLLAGLELRRAGENERDLHVWLDPALYARLVERIGVALGARGRGESLARRVRALDRELRAGLARCRRRTIVTSHAAFGYLAARYGLEQVAISGLAPEAEPTPREFERIVARVRDTGATTVFVETLASPRLTRAVARETGARTDVLDPLEGLTDDQVTRGADYFSVMRANLAALRRGLECA